MCNCGSRRSAPRQGPTVTVSPVPPPVRSRALPPPSRQRTIPSTVGLPTVDTSIWGPPLWRILHTLAELTTSPEQAAVWPALLAALQNDLPCPDCRKHFTDWYRTHVYTLAPPRVRQRYIMVNRRRVLAPPPQAPEPQAYTRQWVLDLHNNVNRRYRRPTWSPGQVEAAYGSAESVTLAREALASLAGVIGLTAHGLLTAMAPPQPEVAQQPTTTPQPEVTQQPTTNEDQPLLVVEEPPTQPEEPIIMEI